MFSVPSDLFFLTHDSEKDLLEIKSVLRQTSTTGFICAACCGHVEEPCHVPGCDLKLMMVRRDV